MSKMNPETISEAILLVENLPGSAVFITPNSTSDTSAIFFGTPNFFCDYSDYSNVIEFLNTADSYINSGHIGYALLPYEFGFLFEPILNNLAPKNLKINPSFHFYDKSDLVTNLKDDLFEFSSDNEKFEITDFKLNMTKDEYSNAIDAILNEIEEGNTYQVNYTTKAKFKFKGSISKFFIQLLFNQSAPYACLINTPKGFIVSLSPELFIRIEGDTITTVPMKGTAKRGINRIEDELNFATFKSSLKDQTENLIIVDLLRNDLGAISEFGTVKVNSFFDIQKLETVYQMTSEITAQLKSNSLADILPAIFPCGSITGAPKCKTMEIIANYEAESRNMYTGSIGLILPDKILFNVVIRSALIDTKTKVGEIGLGSGIVWDSKADKEYEEIIYKGEFLTKSTTQFDLIESILIENGEPFLLERHIERLKLSAEFHLFRFKEEQIRKKISEIVKCVDKNQNYKLRLVLSKSGKLLTTKEVILPVSIGTAALSKEATKSADKFLYFKTTNRNLYNREYIEHSKNGFFDVIFRNEEGYITEGAISNVMIKQGDCYYTPPISVGLLDGVYRAELISNGILTEKKLRLEDLLSADEIWLINSVRKSVRITHLSIGD